MRKTASFIRRKPVITAIFITGFSGIVGQMLLLRELLIVFSGNEFSIGIVFANWLVLEAFGSFFVGKRAERSRNPVVAYVLMTFAFSLSLPPMVHVVRMLRPLLGLSIAEGIGLLPILWTSFLILMPVSVFHGALFTFGCKLYSLANVLKKEAPKTTSGRTSPAATPEATFVGRVYVYETLGTIAGGVAWTYLLIPYLHAFQTAFALAAINSLVCAALLAPFASHHAPFRRQGTLATLALLLFLASGWMLFTGRAGDLHRLSTAAQWSPQNLVHYRNSLYNNIAVVETEGHYTFFLDGSSHIETPTPDIAFVEEFVHIPMLGHPNPERLLFIGGGAGGKISEALKHPSVKSVEYAELDPMLLEVIGKFPTPLTEGELKDRRTTVRNIDGRLLLKTTDERYDLIFIGLRDLSDLRTNRFFTREFFSLAEKRLAAEGLLVFALPGSLTYPTNELRDLNASVYNAAKIVFPYVRGIPGEGANLYLASNSAVVELFDAAHFATRSAERRLRAAVLVPRHIENKLHPGWAGWFSDLLEGGTRKINRDFAPVSVFYTVAHWNTIFTPALRAPFRRFEQTDPRILLALAATAVALLGLLRFKWRRFGGSGLPFSIGTTGFAGMMFDLALIFVFQALYGYVFAWIGLLVTAFMAGSACGATLITRALPRIKDDVRCLLRLDLAIIAFTLLLPLIVHSLQPFLENPLVFRSIRFVILLLSFVGGLLTSAQFPLANRIYLRESGDLSRTAGLFYGSDLLGGWCGGILTGVLFLPVLGLLGTCVATALLKACGFILVALRKNE